MQKPIFTVFTPTYNRVQTLPRVFHSLQNQTFTQFEWLIVDDGSTDSTHDLITEYQKTSLFSIKYIYQTNSGKHVAWNRALEYAQGNYFLVLDSDDGCVPNALERFRNAWKIVQDDPQIIAVVSLCQDIHGRVLGSRFPVRKASHVDMTLLHHLSGEKWECWKTVLLRQFPFPEDVRGVLAESYLLNRISRHYQNFYINEALRIYYQDTLSLTRQKNPTRHSQGQILVHAEFLNTYAHRLFQNPLYFLLSSLKFTRHAFYLGLGPVEQLNFLCPVGKFLWLVTLLPAMIIVFLERWAKTSLSGKSSLLHT